MPTRRAFPCVILAVALAACAPKAAEQAAAPVAVDTAAVQAALAGFWPRWISAAMAGDTAAMGALLADSVRIDSKGIPPVLGRAGWITVFETMLKTMKVESEVITPEATSVVGNDLAYQTGDFVETTTTAGKTQADYGRYAAAIRKDADGQWRLSYVMAFPDSTVPVKK
jgi:ketosteroid isomerase-like protein